MTAEVGGPTRDHPLARHPDRERAVALGETPGWSATVRPSFT